jgi:hypothetical protein
MNKAKLNYFVDLGLFMAFLLISITGIIKFPGWGLYGSLGFKGISKIHDWSGIALVVLVLVHLILHWPWIKSMTKCFFKKKKKSCEVDSED